MTASFFRGIALGGWLVVLASRVALAADDAPAGQGPTTSEITYLDQGWGPQQRQQFYRTYQGSELIPYPWFLVLEQDSNRELFKASENIERFRYLPEEARTPLNGVTGGKLR